MVVSSIRLLGEGRGEEKEEKKPVVFSRSKHTKNNKE